MKLRSILLFGIVLAACLALGAQQSERLHLVTALPTPYAPPVQSALWRVENNQLVLVAELNTASAGSDFVVVDHDRRVLLLGAPHQDPKQFVVVDMDHPSVVRTLNVSVPSWALRFGLLLDSPRGLLFSAVVNDDGAAVRRDKLVGVSLSTGAAVDLPWDAYSGFRRDGWWLPGDGYATDFEVTVKNDKLLGTVGELVTYDFGLAVPRNIAPESQRFRVAISNDSMLALDRPSVRGGRPPGPRGRTQLEIYDKASRAWHTENFNSGGTSVRAFNEWLAVNEGDYKPEASRRRPDDRESPGASQRKKVLNPQAGLRDQLTVEDLFRESEVVFDGSIDLVNIRSGKRYDLNTGEGDTEVLLIEGSRVYYRVNDSLFRAQLGDNNIGNPVELVKDDRVQSAHWAFFGP